MLRLHPIVAGILAAACGAATAQATLPSSSNTKGAHAGVSVAGTDMVLDRDANRASYRREGRNPQPIIEGEVPNVQSKVLDRVLRA